MSDEILIGLMILACLTLAVVYGIGMEAGKHYAYQELNDKIKSMEHDIMYWRQDAEYQKAEAYKYYEKYDSLVSRLEIKEKTPTTDNKN